MRFYQYNFVVIGRCSCGVNRRTVLSEAIPPSGEVHYYEHDRNRLSDSHDFHGVPWFCRNPFFADDQIQPVSAFRSTDFFPQEVRTGRSDTTWKGQPRAAGLCPCPIQMLGEDGFDLAETPGQVVAADDEWRCDADDGAVSLLAEHTSVPQRLAEWTCRGVQFECNP